MLNFIETERLIVREPTRGDRLALYENIYHDSKTLEYFIGQYLENFEETKIEPLLTRVENGQYIYAVTLKENGECIGFMFEQHRDNDAKSIEMGYAYGSKYWGKGYATEAFKAVIAQLFKDGFKTVTAAFLMENVRSKRVMEKCGMIYDYVAWKAVAYHYKKHDVVYYRIENPAFEKAAK